MTQNESELPERLDDALAFAYGEGADPAPSVLSRIGEIAGSTPKVVLREETAGDTPMLKPLAADARRTAGKYVVQGELGRGGVGAVHKGHDQDLGRDVAMKFLHERYKDQPAILHRFVEEAQIGGQLQHPGIVPVYDLGLVDGRPFFAMKLIKGQTLAKKLAERSSLADDRRTFLTIFEDVCQTLAYAHARGVVHRDLKPANIMIGSFGEVQVVDWGMGKVLRHGGVDDEKLAAERQIQLSVIETVRSGGHGTQSLVGSVMGTPAYMPPEQARGDVEAMDERSDVFALGAILCEILTGKPPYVGAPDELIAMAAMARLDDANARLAACGAEPEMVELATRCMMPAPAARPRSAEVVAKTVHDHLAAAEARVHEARVETAEAKVRAAALKRTQKLGISLTVVIAVGLAVSLWFWRAADGAAERAERELARAVEIKTLITDMLKGVTPEQARGVDTTLLRGILDTAAVRLAEGAIEDELVAAELHAVTGWVYTSLGLYPEAEQHVPVALEIRERLLGAEHEKTLGSVENFGTLRLHEGRYDEAEALYRRTLEGRTRVLGADHEDTIRATANLSALLGRRGRQAESEALNLELLDVARRVLGDEHDLTLSVLQNLASGYSDRGRWDEAEALHRRTLEILERVHGEEHPQTLSAMGNLANLYMRQGRYAEAEPLERRVLELHTRIFGEEHPATLSAALGLADLLESMGRDAEAAPIITGALEVQERLLGEDHPDTLRSAGLLGINLLKQGRLAEAEALTLRAFRGRVRVLGETHTNTLASLGNLAIVYERMGRYAEAEEVYVKLGQLQAQAIGADHPNTIGTGMNLGALHEKQGRFDAAEAMYRKTLEAQVGVLGGDHPDTVLTRSRLGGLYLDQGRIDEAAELLPDALQVQRRLLSEEHPNTITTMAKVARLRQAQARLDEAEALYDEVIELQARTLGEESEETIGNRGNLAMLYHRQGRYAEAEALFLEVLDAQRRVLGEEHLNTLGTITNLGNLYNSMGRFEEAATMFEVSLPAKRRVLGENHPWTGYALQGLMTAYLRMGRAEEALPLQREALDRAFAQAGDDPSAEVLNEFAWVLLTVEVEGLQDPERALALARRACELEEAEAGEQLWQCLDTLALALHRTGDTAAAVETQRRALALMPEDGDSGVGERLAEYEAALRDR